jgi:AraC-like DNA-binding protein
VRLRPGAAASVFGLPASELLDLSLEASALWGPTAGAVGERVSGSPSPLAALRVLEHELARRATGAAGPDPLVAEAVRRLMPWGVDGVGALTRSLFISERQLRRRCEAAVGLAPKPLQRILRFQGFLALAQRTIAQGRAPSEDGLALLAAEAGYADQSHLSRECLRLTGASPRAFLEEAEGTCACGHDHSASFARLLRASGSASS